MLAKLGSALTCREELTVVLPGEDSFSFGTLADRPHTRCGITLLPWGQARVKRAAHKGAAMSMGTILLILLILILVGVFPSWPHSRSWGYGPSSIAGVVVVVLVAMWLLGHI